MRQVKERVWGFEVVKKGQDLQQVVELKLEKKIGLIVEDHRNQEIVIIENIVEDPLEVKGEDESITHNPRFQLIYWRRLHNMLIFLE